MDRHPFLKLAGAFALLVVGESRHGHSGIARRSRQVSPRMTRETSPGRSGNLTAGRPGKSDASEVYPAMKRENFPVARAPLLDWIPLIFLEPNSRFIVGLAPDRWTFSRFIGGPTSYPDGATSRRSAR
jgi:hypothetical protein